MNAPYPAGHSPCGPCDCVGCDENGGECRSVIAVHTNLPTATTYSLSDEPMRAWLDAFDLTTLNWGDILVATFTDHGDTTPTGGTALAASATSGAYGLRKPRILNEGTGYTGSGFGGTFTLAFSGGGGGSGLAGYAYVRGGKVVSLAFSSLGSGYTSAPTIDLSAGGGSGAVATLEYGRMTCGGEFDCGINASASDFLVMRTPFGAYTQAQDPVTIPGVGLVEHAGYSTLRKTQVRAACGTPYSILGASSNCVPRPGTLAKCKFTGTPDGLMLTPDDYVWLNTACGDPEYNEGYLLLFETLDAFNLVDGYTDKGTCAPSDTDPSDPISSFP